MQNVAARLPRKLYKYRSFGVTTLRMLGQGEAYFALPAQFNDPFDCSPTVRNDVEIRELERVWRRLVSRAMTKDAVLAQLHSYRYSATEYGRHDDGAKGTEVYRNLLVNDVDEHVKAHFAGRGVLSLAARWDNPLMWSHYADEHRGICIEFDTADHRCERLEPVAYGSTRYLLVSDLRDWFLNGSRDAEDKIGRQFLFAKAPQWRHEREWRAIASGAGVDGAPFKIAAVHLGLRCDQSIQTAVVKMLADARERIRFYGMWSKGDGFELGRYLLDVEEILAVGVQESSKFAADDFATVD
jgi:hypothetical protein